MSLLSVENVSKRYRRGIRERIALQDVSFAVEPGELVAVLGPRKCGRSTLLRTAAGLERPDQGVVRFDGESILNGRDVVGRRVCYCRTSFSPMEGEHMVDHVAAALLAQGVPASRAKREAEVALARTAVAECARMHPDELSGPERVRVALARGLVAHPKLLVADDPVSGVAFTQRDGILRLLRSIANEGVAVLMSTDDATCISGADRVFALDDGRLRIDVHAPQAEVVPLRPQHALG